MARTLSYTVSISDGNIRLDVLLAEHSFYASRSAAVHAIDRGGVFVNGVQVAKKHLVQPGDTIVYEVVEDSSPSVLRGQPIALDIRYEDDALLVLSKQAGLVCHPSTEHRDTTLVNALIYHCGASHLCNVQGEHDRLGIVHRLDRDTTGLMLAAKDDETGYALMEAIRTRTIDRRYLALVHGIIPHDTGMIDAPLARSPKDRTQMAVRNTPSSRDAMTTFRVLERFEQEPHDEGYTLIDCKLYTGRTHQIRVHMAYAKHPLVGEPVYKQNTPKHAGAQLGLARQFLHSFRLQLNHPLTGETMLFHDSLPNDLRAVLDSLASRSEGRTAAGDEVAGFLRDKDKEPGASS